MSDDTKARTIDVAVSGIRKTVSEFIHRDSSNWSMSSHVEHNLDTSYITVTLWDEEGRQVTPLSVKVRSHNAIHVTVGTAIDRARAGLPTVDHGTVIRVVMIG